LKDIKSISDPLILKKLESVIITIESAQTLSDIPHLKKLKGFPSFFRIRMNHYRLGISIENNIIWIERCLNRNEIYKKFPR